MVSKHDLNWNKKLRLIAFFWVFKETTVSWPKLILTLMRKDFRFFLNYRFVLKGLWWAVNRLDHTCTLPVSNAQKKIEKPSPSCAPCEHVWPILTEQQRPLQSLEMLWVLSIFSFLFLCVLVLATKWHLPTAPGRSVADFNYRFIITSGTVGGGSSRSLFLASRCNSGNDRRRKKRGARCCQTLRSA